MSTSLYFQIDCADEQEGRVPVSIEHDFSVLPADWPGIGHEGPLPSDMSHFVPQGLAMSAPRIVTPYLGAPEPAYYGAANTIIHPVKSAPLNDDAGGVFYFSRHMMPTTLVAALDLFGFRSLETEYALFLATSEQPREDNFLDTLRIVSLPALRHFYRCDTSALAAQARNAGEAVTRFLEWQVDKWQGSSALMGSMGGDGDWAKERLAFGVLIENSYWGVYRVWSRAWLVTK